MKNWLKESSHTVVFTGAGMSTESGLPDFRSANQGLWKQKDPSKIASTDALNSNVDEFIEFYRSRVLTVKDYKPHKGHHILADWEKEGIIHSIITQNVDGFHQAAGSQNVSELHGTLTKVHCQSCGREYKNEAYVNQTYNCECGGILRPSITLFGEMLPQDAFQLAQSESEQADLFIVLGSSLSVTPANQFPLIAKDNGARLVIVNREPTEFDRFADEVIHSREIGEVLEEWNH
ncbi:NAD-dependent protein deacylase [Lentibacillus amyloliquefaciens]|uniref:NAD-dependent protein deacetylase n=1 Tax=Lentibacillus amyloliquefaciens TaxID=1472767 RepID=A0A0U3W6P8_9BACI|nr:NAD-dependent protein deacylase [Lentibacillus amyloliquefaciens]ALX48864.1 NAD-dependent deacetylase [Lentibacillus amyloliquefaciens]